MAIVPQIVYTATDESGEVGTTSINVPTGFSLTQYGEFGAAMATLLDKILDGKVESADICFGVDISSLINNIPIATSDREAVGAFQFRTLQDTKVNINVPTLYELKVGAGSDDIDQGDSDVAAFITAVEDGIAVTGGTVIPCDVGELDIDQIVYARESFRPYPSKG